MTKPLIPPPPSGPDDGGRIVDEPLSEALSRRDLADALSTITTRALPDVRDGSAEDIRLVLEPKSRSIEPEMLMESLFRLCDLEVRFPINMNVLDATGTPRVMGLKTMLASFLDFRREVVVRRGGRASRCA